jgi:hypothetical protein
MPPSSTPPPDRSGFQIQEIRYRLADMLKEVAIERQTGAFGMERLRQSEIRKVIRNKPRKRNASGN